MLPVAMTELYNRLRIFMRLNVEVVYVTSAAGIEGYHAVVRRASLRTFLSDLLRSSRGSASLLRSIIITSAAYGLHGLWDLCVIT